MTMKRIRPTVPQADNIHNQVKIQTYDSHGRESLAQYILRFPFSQQKMTYRKDTKTVLYRSKMNPNLLSTL
ncbi:MAG: hypothetical protein O6948_10505 [Deltaproteobacteria bacterium]|nr:hypothetical protein [Deltaproteobacteria bacterium]